MNRETLHSAPVFYSYARGRNGILIAFRVQPGRDYFGKKREQLLGKGESLFRKSFERTFPPLDEGQKIPLKKAQKQPFLRASKKRLCVYQCIDRIDQRLKPMTTISASLYEMAFFAYATKSSKKPWK